MLIDFHTHIFPEKIAKRTEELLSTNSGIQPACGNTLEGLRASMAACGVDYSVTLPIATRPEQTEHINDAAIALLEEDGVISFGSIHPHYSAYREELRRLRSSGIRGIKLHPDYQDFFIDDPEVRPVLQDALDLGLIVVVHTGVDLGKESPYRATPKRCAEFLRHTDSPNMVFAHMGGYLQWDETMEYLAGKNCYFDTAFSLKKRMGAAQFVELVRAHGADRILFATDSPWQSPREAFDAIDALPLTEAEKRGIFYENACRLLGRTNQ